MPRREIHTLDPRTTVLYQLCSQQMCQLSTLGCAHKFSSNPLRKGSQGASHSSVPYLLERTPCPVLATSQSVTKPECPVRCSAALPISAADDASKLATAVRAPSSPAHTKPLWSGRTLMLRYQEKKNRKYLISQQQLDNRPWCDIRMQHQSPR